MTKWGVFAVTCLPWACSNSAPAEDQPCPSGGTRCGGECVDTTTDIGNCGQCGRVCPTGVGCFASACTSPGSLNQPRQGHALVKGHDGRIYCIGGAYGATALQEIGDVEVYDPRTNHWRRVESLVTPRAMLGAAARDGQIIAFGGGEAFIHTGAQHALAASEVYDPAADLWSPGASLPVGRADAAVAAAPDGRVWVIGGWSSWIAAEISTVDDVSVLGADWIWSQPTLLPTPATRHGARAVATPDGRIWLLGGRPASMDPPFLSVDVLDPDAATWRQAKQPTLGAHYLGAVALGVDGTIYVIGGDDGHSATTHVEAYDPATETSAPVAELPIPLFDTAAVTGDDGRIYVVGGVPAMGAPALEAMFVYDPIRKVWYQ